MPNLEPWRNNNEDMATKTINKFENHLLSTIDNHHMSLENKFNIE